MLELSASFCCHVHGKEREYSENGGQRWKAGDQRHRGRRREVEGVWENTRTGEGEGVIERQVGREEKRW